MIMPHSRVSVYVAFSVSVDSATTDDAPLLAADAMFCPNEIPVIPPLAEIFQ